MGVELVGLILLERCRPGPERPSPPQRCVLHFPTYKTVARGPVRQRFYDSLWFSLYHVVVFFAKNINYASKSSIIFQEYGET